MATFSATATRLPARAQLRVARPPTRAQLRVARADTLRCSYSKEGLKACLAMNLSPDVLKGLGLQQMSRPWGSKLVEERVDTEGSRLPRLTRALSPEWVLACVLGYIFFNLRRLQRIYDDQKSGGLTF